MNSKGQQETDRSTTFFGRAMLRPKVAMVSAVVIAIGLLAPQRPKPLIADSPQDASTQQSESAGQSPSPDFAVPTSVNEARDRARILHEAMHGALQVMHRDFFDEENIHAIPSRSLEDVFLELGRSYGVSVRWISVNAKALNIDHQPSDEFEKNAAKALSAGKQEFESYEAGSSNTMGSYRHVGSIRMASQCLKCHLPNRRSNQDRLAGLSITMKVAGEPAESATTKLSH